MPKTYQLDQAGQMNAFSAKEITSAAEEINRLVDTTISLNHELTFLVSGIPANKPNANLEKPTGYRVNSDSLKIKKVAA